jgi:hypothetical protein
VNLIAVKKTNKRLQKRVFITQLIKLSAIASFIRKDKNALEQKEYSLYKPSAWCK